MNSFKDLENYIFSFYIFNLLLKYYSAIIIFNYIYTFLKYMFHLVDISTTISTITGIYNKLRFDKIDNDIIELKHDVSELKINFKKMDEKINLILDKLNSK
jgi:hypothetical protein